MAPSLTRFVLATLLSSLFLPALAQDFFSSSPAACTFSCPTEDLNGLALAKRPYVVGFNSTYSIFECVFHSASSPHPEHKCSYYKPTGNHMLGYKDDGCPPTAVVCDDDNPTPSFSNFPKDEVPPWFEVDRSLLYLKEHHRA
ncbi:hypothetical protein BJ165DRAFT_1519287 [Panaeolus papilionaceus]|nr:hypothetical protein BJ165DRAFT_1519287 [Panaeolus papilionaceus]